MQRLLAERRRDLRLRDQLEADRQRAELDQVREVLGALNREAALDHRAVLAVDAVGQLLRVDRRDGDESAVERDGEVLEHRLGVDARQRQRRAALRDLARDVVERRLAGTRESELDVGAVLAG